MTRADDLQAAHISARWIAPEDFSDPLWAEHKAIPDLLAVVRAAQAYRLSGSLSDREAYDLAYAAFEGAA